MADNSSIIRYAKTEQTLLQAVINAVPAPIFYKDIDGRYLGCNKAFEEYIGLTRQKLVGRTVFELFSPELARVYAEADQVLLDNNGEQIYEAQVKYADGSLRDVMFHKATFNALTENLSGLVGVILDITERKKVELKYRRLAHTDTVTQIDNRFSFMHNIETAIAQLSEGNRRVALMMIDLDDFKSINDSYGHLQGDRVLAEVARRLKQSVRSNDRVARLGGDEFAVLIHDPVNLPHDLAELANRILEANQQPIALGDETMLNLRISIGIAVAPDNASDVDGLMHCADLALYRVKESGKNDFHLYEISDEPVEG